MRLFDLVCFDVDGTLIDRPDGKTVWQILNERFAGSDALNEARMRDYLAKRIRYDEWVALDVGDWIQAGATRAQAVEALKGLALIDGARETVGALKEEGCRLAVVSGTLDLCLELLFPAHPFDEVFTNRIWFDKDGRLSGWEATPFDMEGKAGAMREIRRREGFTRERCAFVGDHFNDIAAAKEAGFSIAFNPKSPALERVASVVVRGRDLRGILPHLTAGDGIPAGP
jgi:phosphoserine phosphatase